MTKKSKPTPEEVLSYFVWQCGDCQNTYTLNVQNCPNTVLDELILQGVTLNDS